MAGNVPCAASIVTGTFNLCYGGVDFGCTTGGVSISFDRNYEDVRCDQSCDIIARFLTEQTLTITVNILEPTLDKMRIIYGQTDSLSADGTILCLQSGGNGTNCTFPEEYPLLICGPGPGCGCRNFYFERAIITPTNVDYTITKTAPVELAVEFTILPTCPDGVLGCISDQCDVVATSVEGGIAGLTPDDLCTPDVPFPAYEPTP